LRRSDGHDDDDRRKHRGRRYYDRERKDYHDWDNRKGPVTGDGRRADISSIETSTGSTAEISPNTGDGGIIIPGRTTGIGITDRWALGRIE